MIGRASFTSSMRLFVVVLLVAIGLQAVPSGDLPIVRDHGSAFSASSFESAVARQTDTVTTAVSPHVLPPPNGLEQLSRVAAVGTVWRAADVTSLSAWAIASPPYLPRPPPQA